MFGRQSPALPSVDGGPYHAERCWVRGRCVRPRHGGTPRHAGFSDAADRGHSRTPVSCLRAGRRDERACGVWSCPCAAGTVIGIPTRRSPIATRRCGWWVSSWDELSRYPRFCEVHDRAASVSFGEAETTAGDPPLDAVRREARL